MTALLVYAAVLLLGIAILVNRRGERRLDRLRRDMVQDERILRDLDRQVQDARRRGAAADQALREAEAREAEARRNLEAAERRLAEARRQPVERFHVFDRLEPRPGRVWAVRITQSASDPLLRDGRRAGAWSGPRTYLLIAGSRKEVLDRAGLRFARSVGYEVEEAVPSPLFHRTDAEAAPTAAATPRAPATLAAGRGQRVERTRSVPT